LLSAQASADQNRHGAKNWKGHASASTKYVQPRHQKKSRYSKRRKPVYNVNREQRQQAVMIQQGIRTCQITPREARVLNKQQSRIRKAERKLRRNGLKRWEANTLKISLHTARVQINRLTKNRKTCGRKHRGYKHGQKRHNQHGQSRRNNRSYH